MSDELEWPFSITGNAAEQIEQIDHALSALPKDLDQVEKGMRDLEKVFAANKIAKIADPLKQNYALLKMQADQLRDVARAADQMAEAEGRAAKAPHKGNDESVGSGLAKGLGLGDMAKLATGAGLAEAGAELLVDALKTGIGLAKDLAVGFVKIGVESSEAYKQQIGSMQGLQGDAAKETVDGLDDMANAAGRDGDAVLDAFRGMRNAGFDTAQSFDVLAASSDVKWLAGGSDTAAKSFEETMAKIKTMGKVGAKDLKAITDSIPVDELANALGGRIGKSADVALKLLQKGDASSIDVQNAMLDAVQHLGGGDALGSYAIKTAQGNVGAQLGVLKDAFGDLFKDVDASPLAEAMHSISVVLNGETGEKLKKEIGGAFSWIAEKINGVDFEKWLGKGVTFIEDARVAFEHFGTGLGPGIAGLETIGKLLDATSSKTRTNGAGWEVLGGIVGGLGVAVGLGFAPFVWAYNQVTDLYDAVKQLGSALKDTLPDALESLEQFFGFGKNASKGMADGIAAGQPDVEKAAADMANAVPETVETQLDINSPSRVLFDDGQYTGEGFIQGLERSDPASALDFGSDLAMPSFDGANLNGRGGVTIGSIQVTVAGGSSAEETGRAVAATVRVELLSILAELEAS